MTGPLLDLESRLLVAIAARGNQRIGQLLFELWATTPQFFIQSDEALVSAVEQYVAEHQV